MRRLVTESEDRFSHVAAHVYKILLEWQLYMYLCILNVRYVLLYTLVRQINDTYLLTYLQKGGKSSC